MKKEDLAYSLSAIAYIKLVPDGDTFLTISDSNQVKRRKQLNSNLELYTS